MIKVVIFVGLIGLCVAEAPYAASGYRPSQAQLALPGEYGAPPLHASSVHVSQENVEFAGQIVEVNTGAQRPNNAYFAPSNQFAKLKDAKSKNEAFLPKRTPPKPFHSLNKGEVFVVPQQSARLRNPVFIEAKSVFSTRQQLPQFQQIRQFNAHQQFQRQQVDPTVYGPPQTQGYPYPPSQQGYPYPAANPPPPVHEVVHEPTTEFDDPEDDTTDPTVIAVSNASGQYYILGKDNTLQRVAYEAIQTEDDVANNGFTARLRYSPVEPIRDPVYGYDASGQLVRIYNRKK